MKVIIEGHTVETTEIWDIVYKSDPWGVYVTIKITDKPDLVIGRKLPYDMTSSRLDELRSPYIKLYKSIKEQWEADMSETKVFKL